MLYPIGNVEALKKLNELATLQDQVNAVRLQDKLGKQKFDEDIKKVFEPLTDAIKKISEVITKTITETSMTSNKQPRV